MKVLIRALMVSVTVSAWYLYFMKRRSKAPMPLLFLSSPCVSSGESWLLLGTGAGGVAVKLQIWRRGEGVSVGFNLMCGLPSGRHSGAVQPVRLCRYKSG